MKKTLLPFYFIILTLIGCDFGGGPTDYTYRYNLIVDTNLKKLQIGITSLDSTIIYPYKLADRTENGQIGDLYIISPIKDTGFIKLVLYGDKSFQEPSLSFKDSLTIYTPIDTTFVHVTLDNLNEGKLSIIPNPDTR